MQLPADSGVAVLAGEGDPRIHEIIARDALGRSPGGARTALPFDRSWTFELLLTANGGSFVRAEAARIFPVQPLIDEAWEEHQFGAVLAFPFAEDSGDYENACTALVTAAMALLGERYPPMRVYCLLPASATRQAAILRSCGFEPQERTCLETEILVEHGFHARHGQIVLFQSTAAATRDDGPDPLRQLTSDPVNLRIFSNAQTKIRLQPTLEFWGAIQLYTTYSAYPFIPQFLQRLQTQFGIGSPRRLLVSPSAGGDFLRLWPLASGVPDVAVGVDIRKDLLRIAALRVRIPEIDILNLSLSEVLHELITTGRVLPEVGAALSALYEIVHATRRSRSLLRYDDPASLPLLARAFDQILQNRAIPDWYFPLKILASADPVTRDPVRADSLAQWLELREAEIRRAVAELALLTQRTRDKYAATGLGERATFHPANLTQDETIPAGPFDLILCWEFVHVYHDFAALGRFIDSLLARLAPGGTLVITNIREPSQRMPYEQEWTREHLEASGVRYAADFVGIAAGDAGDHVPFERRLHAHYPVLVAQAKGEG